MMECLIIGYGSIGKRHLRILKDLGCRVSVVTSQKIDCEEYYSTIKEAFEKKSFDYVVIANPTYLHYNALIQLIQCDFQGIVLIEKPLFVNIEELPNHKIKKILVAYNLRFHELLIQTKNLIENQEMITFSAYVGQYLPTWRKGRDYRTCYSATKKQGGGVLRDLSHELDYSLWLCGPFTQVAAMGGHYSQLEIDSDDTYSLMMKCTSCPIVNLHINYLDKVIKREITINTQHHTIGIDFMKGTLSVDGELQNQVSDGMAKTYLKQHQAVIENNFTHFCQYSEGLSVMKLIEAAEKASASKTWISL